MTESTSSAAVQPENLSLFPAGDPNTAYAKFFVGKSWLKLLTKDRLVVANVTSTTRAVRFFSSRPAAAGTRKKASPHRRSNRATSSTFRPR